MPQTRRQQMKARLRKERIRREKHQRRFASPETERELHLPSPYMMERLLRGAYVAAGKHGCLDSAEVTGVVDRFMRKPHLDENDPREMAQEFAYRAMEASSPEEVLENAFAALRLDSACVDAMAIVCHCASPAPSERVPLLRQVLKIAELDLGPEFLQEWRGELWGNVMARPYMRVRQNLAAALEQSGQTPEAIAEYEEMLELNAGDNQGVRDSLLPLYFITGNLEAARVLMERYGEDASALFQWGRVLERCLSNDREGAAAALEQARQCNRHVEKFLNRTEKLPQTHSDYVSPGQPSEASWCALSLGPAWHAHADAVAWLRNQRVH